MYVQVILTSRDSEPIDSREVFFSQRDPRIYDVLMQAKSQGLQVPDEREVTYLDFAMPPDDEKVLQIVPPRAKSSVMPIVYVCAATAEIIKI